MDNKEFNLRKDWDSIETVASDIWPEEWSQLNPLEIKALEEIIEKKEITEHGNCGRTWWYGLRFFRGPGECILPACHSMVSEKSDRNNK